MKGFTLIELIITLALIVFIGGATVLGLSGQRSSQNLKQTLNEFISVIRDTQNKSITQESGKQWGIRFSNLPAIQKYEVFSGPSYALGTVSKMYSLSRGIKFSEPPASSTYDLVFSAISGQLPGNKIISLVTGRKDSFVGDIIFNTFGLTTSRFENNLVGYWHLDEGTGTSTVDASGIGNTGILTNGPTWQSGSSCKAGGCLSFSGNADWVSVGDSTSLNIIGSLSVGVWVNATLVNGVRHNMVRKGGNYNYALIIESSNRFRGYLYNGTSWPYVDDTAIMSTGTWYNVVMTWDNTAKLLSLYRDGILRSTSTWAGTTIQSSAGQSLGISDSDTSLDFSGTLDEVRIYNRALSATEIQAMYNDLK